VKIIIGCAALILVIAWWLWTPDKSRAALEAQYAKGPAEFRTVSGIRLHVRVSGPEDAPVVILLHGFGASLQTWDDWAALLPEYRIVRFDLPGFALTGPDPTADYSDERSEEVIESLMGELGVERATLIGHSLGGRIAWRFAADHPDRVDRLVLIAPDGFASPGFAYGKAADVPFVVRAMRYALPRSLLRSTLAASYANPNFLTDELVSRYYDLMLAPGVRAAMIERLEQTVLVDPVPLLSRIRAPTLLVWGEKDAMIPIANSADYRRVLPESTLAAFPGVGHLPQEEAPAQSIQPVRQFLSRESGSREVMMP